MDNEISTTKVKKILSIGGGGAGMFSLIVPSQLKKGKFEITTLSDEKDIYCRCSTPYIFTKRVAFKDAVHTDDFVEPYGLKIIHEKAISLDTKKQEVRTNHGNVFSYDYLVLSTGASPIKPNLSGLDLPGVFTVRTSDDTKNISAKLRTAKKAVVVGAGVIGMEMAGAFSKRGLDVFLVEKMPSLSSEIFGTEYAEKLIKLMTDNGINLFFDSELKSVNVKNANNQAKNIQKEVLIVNRDGQERILDADIVVLAIGVRPNLNIIKDTPIKATKDGIIVDRKMRTNIKNIYACGDCCVPFCATTGKYIPSRLASSAIQQSKTVGFQIAGFPIQYNGSTGAFAFETLGKQFAAAGLDEEAARKHFKWVVVGRAKTKDLYEDIKTSQDLEIKLIFAGPKMRLVGYEGFGFGVISSAEVASLAISLRLSILSLLKFNYISHPSMTSWPFTNPIIMATEDAMGSIMQKFRNFFGI